MHSRVECVARAVVAWPEGSFRSSGRRPALGVTRSSCSRARTRSVGSPFSGRHRPMPPMGAVRYGHGSDTTSFRTASSPSGVGWLPHARVLAFFALDFLRGIHFAAASQGESRL